MPNKKARLLGLAHFYESYADSPFVSAPQVFGRCEKSPAMCDSFPGEGKEGVHKMC